MHSELSVSMINELKPKEPYKRAKNLIVRVPNPIVDPGERVKQSCVFFISLSITERFYRSKDLITIDIQIKLFIGCVNIFGVMTSCFYLVIPNHAPIVFNPPPPYVLSQAARQNDVIYDFPHTMAQYDDSI